MRVADDFHDRRRREEYARSDIGRAILHDRVAVEHAIGRQKNAGAGKSRYMGRRKTLWQWFWIGALNNLKLAWRSAEPVLAGAMLLLIYLLATFQVLSASETDPRLHSEELACLDVQVVSHAYAHAAADSPSETVRTTPRHTGEERGGPVPAPIRGHNQALSRISPDRVLDVCGVGRERPSPGPPDGRTANVECGESGSPQRLFVVRFEFHREMAPGDSHSLRSACPTWAQ